MFKFLSQLPKAARNFLLVEFSERASYYGYRSLLTTFLCTQAALVGSKNFTEAEASSITHANIAITYAMPLVGGILADWFIGKYRSIIFFAAICCLGHLTLAISFHFQDVKWLLDSIFPNALAVFRTGLVFIAVGSGALKPNNSGLYGDLFTGEYELQIENAFKYFYTAVNVGSLLSFTFIPLIAEHYSYDWGFGIPGILMALSTVMLIYARKSFVHVPPTGASSNNFIFINLEILWLKIKGVPNAWTTVENRVGYASIDGIKAMWRIIAFFSWFIILWGVYELNGADWVTDAKYLNRFIFTSEHAIPVESVQMVNSFFIITLVPLSIWFFNFLKRRHNIIVTSRDKIIWGMGFIILATLIEGALRLGIDNFLLNMKPQFEQYAFENKSEIDRIIATKSQLSQPINLNALKQSFYFTNHANSHCGISVWWQVLAYFILTIGEICFSISGLELGYRYAPKYMKSSVLSIWYLSTSIGNLMVSLIADRIDHNGIFQFLRGANYYWFFAALLAINAILYKLTLPKMKEKLYV